MLLNYGSSGSDVSSLQQKLNENGYSLPVTGYYGNQTQAAVRDYQLKNGLSVDGIAGPLTWGKLTTAKAAAASSISGVTADTEKGMATTYTPSAQAQAAQKAYEEAMAVPAEAAPDDSALQQLYETLQNREDFSYDPETDASYLQYREDTARQGKRAMEDTMGQAAALSGGYASTYAETAGQQAYNSYLSQLAERLPDFYASARESYDQEEESLQRRYDAAKDLYDRQTQAWQERENQRTSAVTSAQKEAQSQSEFSYQEYQDLLDYYLKRAKLENADYQWRQEFSRGV